MSVTMAKAEGVTVLTITSYPKSKWPLVCHLLGSLCCSPICFVSQSLRQQLGCSNTALGTLQILVGLMNIGYGCIFRAIGGPSFLLWDSPFWLGAVFIAAGIVCILAERFPSACLFNTFSGYFVNPLFFNGPDPNQTTAELIIFGCFTVLVNLVSAALGITAIVFYSMDIPDIMYANRCYDQYGYGYRYRYGSYEATQSPQNNALMEMCEHYKHMLKVLHGGVDIMMIVLGVLQICVTISSCVLILKALCRKKKEDEVEDPELYKPLVEEVLSSPVC